MLIKHISKRIYNFMSRYIKTDPKRADIYIYKIETAVFTALNICLVMFAAFLLKSPLSGVSHLSCLIMLRSFCGCLHTDSYFKCSCLIIIFFIIAFFVAKLLVYFDLTDFQLMSGLLMLAFLPIYAFVPIKNKNNPLSESKTKICRIFSIIIYIVLSLLSLYLFFFGILYGTVMIVTLTEISGAILVEIFLQRRENGGNMGNNG